MGIEPKFPMAVCVIKPVLILDQIHVSDAIGYIKIFLMNLVHKSLSPKMP